MAITFQSAPDLVGAASGNISLTPGTIADDDIELACIVCDGTATLSRTNWSNESGGLVNTAHGDFTGAVLWHRASSESGAQAFTNSGGSNLAGFIAAYRGCETSGSPIHKMATAQGTGTSVSVALTSGNAPTIDGCKIVMVVMSDGESNSYGSWAGGSLSWTEDEEDADGEPATAFKHMGIASADQATAAGLTCTATISSSKWVAVAFALLPAATATIDQQSFRVYGDGTESGSTALDTQGTDVTVELGDAFQYRALLQAAGDPSTGAFTLRAQQNGAGGYTAVPVGTPATASLDLAVTAGADDAQQSGSTVTVTGTTIGASLDATTEYVGIRFDNVTIPKGATITAAYVSVVPSGTGEDEPLVTIAGFDEDDTAQFTTTSNDITARAVTTATASWDSTNLGATGSSYHNTPSLVSIVQEIIDRSGWATGNAVGFRIQGGATTTRDLTIEAYENAGANPPLFHVEYSYAPELYIATSANITAGGEDTTQRLTGGTGSFVTGRIWDNENGTDSIDITEDDFTEVAWNLNTQAPAAATDYWDLRVYKGSSPLNSYTDTGRVTIGAGALELDIDTAGSITLAGQSVTMKLGVALATQGAITIAGQSVTAGLSTPLTAGSVTLAGQSITVGTSLALSTEGAITLAGQTVTMVQSTVLPIDTAGQITLAGQSMTMEIDAALGTGQVTLAGQSVTVGLGIDIATAGQVTLAGQSVALAVDVALDNGQVTLAGQAITADLSVAVGNGLITIAGQDMTAMLGVNVSTAGQVTLAGQSVTLENGASFGLDIDVPGSITLTGQDLTFLLTDVAQPTDQPSGGWWPDYEHARRQRIKREIELEEAEAEAKLIQDEIDREIYLLERKQEAEEAEKADLARLQALADQYAGKLAELPKQVSVAILNAQDARTRNSLEQMRREVEQMLEMEEIAIQQIVLLMLDS